MAVRLTKGQKVNLRKDNPNLKRVLVGLGWDPVNQKGSMKKSIIFWLWYLNQVLSGWEIDVDAMVRLRPQPVARVGNRLSMRPVMYIIISWAIV